MAVHRNMWIALGTLLLLAAAILEATMVTLTRSGALNGCAPQFLTPRAEPADLALLFSIAHQMFLLRETSTVSNLTRNDS